MKKLISYLKKEYSFFGVFRSSIPLNFFILQGGVFLFFAYWLLSKDYTVYGYFKSFYGIDRTFVFDGYNPPLYYFMTGQFIYSFLPHITPGVIYALQLIAAGMSVLGFLGVFPKLNAALVFLLVYHFTGMELILNASLDSFTTLPLCFMLVLAISPRDNFYRLGKRRSITESSPSYHWPIFLLFLMVSMYYTFGGLNKFVDAGFIWPLRVHLDVLARSHSEAIVFLASTYSNPMILSLFSHEWVSVFTGTITLFAEIFCFSILFFPRFRFFFLFSLMFMHIFIYYTHCLNYTGNSFLLLLCLDYNKIYFYFKRQL